MAVMSDEERRELALAEVRAARPVGQQSVLTIELSHPSLDEPAYIIQDNADLDARLETGEAVTFRAVSFQLTPPAQSGSRWPEIDLRVDGASGILEPQLDAALAQDEPIMVTFREFVRDDALDGPARVISGLELEKTTAGDLEISGTAGFYGLDRRFGKIYDPAEYPGVR